MNNIPSSDQPISSNGNFCVVDDFEDRFPTGIVGTPDTRGGHDSRLMVKKVNHNATERDRRKKINSLYSSLRSLLPQTDQSKKLSVPATISRVLKYIPELQTQIQQLTREKERLLSCATEQKIDNPREIAGPKVVSTSWISKNEALIQICEGSRAVNGLSGILHDMEINGLSLTNASSFKSSEGGKIFHDLHVRTVEGSRSPQVAQSGVCHEESLPLFDSEFSWHTIVRQCSNLDDLSNRQACAGTS